MQEKETKGLFHNGLFYCAHISPGDIQDIMNFTPRSKNGLGLVLYLQRMALLDEARGRMRTYIVRDYISDELAGYFSLKAGLISSGERAADIAVVFDTMPGVELANFAVNNTYLETHPEAHGVGLVIFNEFIFPLVKTIAGFIGAEFLYIFALPFDKLIERYRTYGFERLGQQEENELHKRLKPKYDKGCIFMYQTIHQVQT